MTSYIATCQIDRPGNRTLTFIVSVLARDSKHANQQLAGALDDARYVGRRVASARKAKDGDKAMSLADLKAIL